MKTRDKPVASRIGRPLSFDRDAALEAAMLLFWRHGYESTSLAQLTAAMGITPPSLYTAFGDKKGLFREAVRRYLGDPQALTDMLEEAPSAREAARRLLEASVRRFTGTDTPSGCLAGTAAASCSDAAADIQAELAAVRATTRDALRRRIARAIAEGELAPDTEPEILATLVLAVIQGISILARDGVSRAVLVRTAGAALDGWPAR